MEAAKPIDLEAPLKPASEAMDVDASRSGEPQEMVAPEVNKEMLVDLESMGFSTGRATRALHFSGIVGTAGMRQRTDVNEFIGCSGVGKQEKCCYELGPVAQVVVWIDELMRENIAPCREASGRWLAHRRSLGQLGKVDGSGNSEHVRSGERVRGRRLGMPWPWRPQLSPTSSIDANRHLFPSTSPHESSSFRLPRIWVA